VNPVINTIAVNQGATRVVQDTDSCIWTCSTI